MGDWPHSVLAWEDPVAIRWREAVHGLIQSYHPARLGNLILAINVHHVFPPTGEQARAFDRYRQAEQELYRAIDQDYRKATPYAGAGGADEGLDGL